jgi:hypothetical protein
VRRNKTKLKQITVAIVTKSFAVLKVEKVKQKSKFLGERRLGKTDHLWGKGGTAACILWAGRRGGAGGPAVTRNNYYQFQVSFTKSVGKCRSTIELLTVFL